MRQSPAVSNKRGEVLEGRCKESSPGKDLGNGIGSIGALLLTAKIHPNPYNS
jgi:hypothetical protein